MNLEGAANVPLTGDWAAASPRRSSTGRLGQEPGAHRQDRRARGLRRPRPASAGAVPAAQGFQRAVQRPRPRPRGQRARVPFSSIIKTGTNDLVDGFDPEKSYTDGVNEQTLHATGGSARLRWGLGAINLYSITGYESVRLFSRGDVDGGPYFRPCRHAGRPGDLPGRVVELDERPSPDHAGSSASSPPRPARCVGKAACTSSTSATPRAAPTT